MSRLPRLDQRGMALPLALFALVIIAALLAGVFYMGRLEQRTGDNFMARAQARSNEWVQHSLGVKVSLSQLLDAVRTVESDKRGFLLTGNQGMLDSSRRTEARIIPMLVALQQEVGDNPSQVENTRLLKAAVLARVQYVARATRRIKDRNGPIARDEVAQALQLMANVLTRIQIMTTEETTVCARLTALGIPFTRHEHPAAATVEEAEPHWADIDAMHCKNLFLRNQKGSRHYLVIIRHSKRADLRAIADQIGDGKLSFGSPERLKTHLGVMPGSVSPFGLIHDGTHQVRVIIDGDLKSADRVSFHPNINTVTLTIARPDFERFLADCGNPVRYVRV